MKEKLSRRLEEIKSELKSGQAMKAELEGRLAQLRLQGRRRTLVLEEQVDVVFVKGAMYGHTRTLC